MFTNGVENSFVVDEISYNYFRHDYNRTFRNERAVEIPIFTRIIDESKYKNLLEIGNVMSHYMRPFWTIVDKFEKGPNVLNVDIVDYIPEKKHDLVLSISTFEHIGKDFGDHGKPVKMRIVLKKLKSDILAPGGCLVFSVPIGYNPTIDEMISNGEFGINNCICMKRISSKNEWKQTKYDEIVDCKFGSPYNNANGLYIGFVGELK